MLTYFLDDIRGMARMLSSSPRNVLYYLNQIKTLRQITNNYSVILDHNNCIVVL